MPVSPPTFLESNLSGYITMSALAFAFSSTWVEAMAAPITGMKISAEISEATMTMITMIGR